MLIELSVANFLSFREKQTFSMVASSRISKKQNVFIPDVDGEKLPPILKVAAIYGPNASGKSNFLRIFDVVRKTVNIAPGSESSLLPVSPFRFDPELIDKPSEFEFHFVANQMRYQFNLSLTAKRVTYERLISYPRGKETLLYERIFDGKRDRYSSDGNLEGEPEVHNAWRAITGARQLFIAQAAASNAEEYPQLKAPFDWLSGGSLKIDDSSLLPWATASKHVIRGNPQFEKELSDFLREIDLPISNIKVSSSEDISSDPFRTYEEFEKMDRASKTTITHVSALGEADFDFSEESSGTKNLIGFWLPWTSLVERGKRRVVAVDEFDSSLHPKIVENLIRRYLASEGGAQLIFTTHNTHLMNSKLLRRDQFWISERDQNAATKLYSVHDFVGREGEDIEKRYFEGRYRGLPHVRKF